MAVNALLNAEGERRFFELHRNATKPEGYTVPWFLGIEHMTRDYEHYIYWKGLRVEHFDHDHWLQAGWRERMRDDAEGLAAHCHSLEQRGTTPA